MSCKHSVVNGLLLCPAAEACRSLLHGAATGTLQLQVDGCGAYYRRAGAGCRLSMDIWRRAIDCVEPLACSSSFATSAVHPVWWLAPTPAPVSPWKYSWN